MNVVVNVVYFFVFFVGSVECRRCWRCFEGVLPSDAMKDCLTHQPSFRVWVWVWVWVVCASSMCGHGRLTWIMWFGAGGGQVSLLSPPAPMDPPKPMYCRI